MRAPRAADGDTRIPFRGVRRKIAEHMVLSKHTAAHFTYVEEIDCTDLVALRERANARLRGAQRKPKLSFLPFIVKATAAALVKFPQLNATLDEAAGEIIQRGHRHIGLATATDAGLIVPVVRDADRLSIVELAARDRAAGEAHPRGKAAREDLSGSTFSDHQPGRAGRADGDADHQPSRGGDPGRPQDHPPPGRRGDGIVIRDLMNLSISVDHRVVDGYDAARFIAEIKATLETPARSIRKRAEPTI